MMEGQGRTIVDKLSFPPIIIDLYISMMEGQGRTIVDKLSFLQIVIDP